MKINWLKLKYQIKAIFTPACWLQNHKCDKEWDEWLWLQLEQGADIVVGKFTALINNVHIWTGNHPYASGTPYRPCDGIERGCSRATSLFLYDELKTAYLIQKLKGPYDKMEFFNKYNLNLPQSIKDIS